MSQSHLISCPTCERHVRAHEPVCPFCAGALSESVRAAVPARRPTGRLTRAAMYAVGATSLTLAAACSSTSSPGNPDGSSADTGTDTSTNDATTDSMQSNDGLGSQEAVAAYGCAPGTCEPVEAGADGAGSDGGGADASEDANGLDGGGPDGVIAAYGAAPDSSK
jgi:hypothetical protein